MEVYLPLDESELFKYICLDQKGLFQLVKGVQAFIFEQPLSLQLLSCQLAASLFSKPFRFSGPLVLSVFEGVFSLLPPAGMEDNEPFHHKYGANI